MTESHFCKTLCVACWYVNLFMYWLIIILKSMLHWASTNAGSCWFLAVCNPTCNFCLHFVQNAKWQFLSFCSSKCSERRHVWGTLLIHIFSFIKLKLTFLYLWQTFSSTFSCGPQRAEDSSKTDVWGPNYYHCPMYFYVYWSWQRVKQVWSAGRIWPMAAIWESLIYELFFCMGKPLQCKHCFSVVPRGQT